MPDNILSLKDKFDVFVLDIYGVIWDGKAPIKGMLEAMAALKQAGKTVILLSNSTHRQGKSDEINAKRGFIKGVHYDKVVTSGDLAYDTFSEDTRRLKFYQLAKRTKELFVDSPYIEVKNPEEADFVYAGVPQIFEDGIWKDFLTLEPFEGELKKIYKLGLPLICANPDMKAHEKQYDEAVVRQGSVARYFEELGGDVEYFGKPYPQIFDFALQGIDVPDERILMVGDTLETDILGGNSYGLKTALTMTGIAKENMEAEGFSSMEEYCREVQIIPDYILA